MPDKIDEILTEVREIRNEQKELKSWLYGADGHEGDIIEIRAGLKNHQHRITRMELVIAGLIGTGAVGAGLIKLLGG